MTDRQKTIISDENIIIELNDQIETFIREEMYAQFIKMPAIRLGANAAQQIIKQAIEIHWIDNDVVSFSFNTVRQTMDTLCQSNPKIERYKHDVELGAVHLIEFAEKTFNELIKVNGDD